MINKKRNLAFALLLSFLFITIVPTSAQAARVNSNCSLKFTCIPSSQTVSEGGQVKYGCSLSNTGGKTCADTSVSAYYAENEKFVSSNPRPTASDYYWFMGDLKPSDSYQFSFTLQNAPGGGEDKMFGEACASANGAKDACLKTEVTVSGGTPSPSPSATPAPTPDPAPVPAPAPSGASGALTQGWIYPGDPSCKATNEYSDGRKIDTLKPEYYQVESNGSLRQMTVSSDGCNGYSASNAADIKAHSENQYATVSGKISNVRVLLSSATLQNNAITTLTNFAVSSGFTGIELDWEEYSSWTATDYSNFKKFTVALQDSLHLKGKKLMIDAPALTGNGSQFKYEDFANLDFVTLMVYDYQYDYGVGEPVAPESWITNVIKYAKSKLPVEKIVIGLPAYGYHGTIGSYNLTIDTYAQSSALPGFSGRKINSEGEEVWTSGNTYYSAQPKSALDRKKALAESLGIKNVSLWHLGGNNWFTEN